MSNLFPLIKVLLKNSLSSISDAKHKGGYKALILVLVVLCFIPLMISIYFFADLLFESMFQIEQEGYVMSLGMQSACTVTLLFSIFLIPSVYYFSKDIKILMALPFKPQEIIASKFIVCLLYEYLFCFGMMIPFLLAYSNYATLDVPFIFSWLFACLTLPIYPLIISSVVTMVIMRFSSLAKRKDLFNVVGSLLMIIVIFGINIYTSNMQQDSLDMNTMITLLMSKDNSLLSVMNYIFPAVPFLTKTMVMKEGSGILIYTLIYVVAIMVFVLCAKIFYFKGAIRADEVSTTSKKFSNKELKGKAKRQNVLFTYMKKEFYVLFRTPAFFINCIVSAVIPAFLFVVMVPSANLAMVKPYINEFLNRDGIVFYLVGIGICIGLLTSNFNLISATAISREGNNYVFMKYIPVPLQTQINAKVLVGIIVSIISTILTLIVLFVTLKFPWYYSVLITVVSIISTFYANYLALFVDLVKPKLVWEQEATAVKQNGAAVVSMLLGMVVSMFLGFALYKIDSSKIAIFTILLLVISLGLCVFCYKYATKLAEKSFRKL